jgi:ABC-type lipoprotein export system ATPase subunit
MNLMKRLNEKLETTIMVVTHDDKTSLFADKKIVIRDGKIEKTYTKK